MHTEEALRLAFPQAKNLPPSPLPKSMPDKKFAKSSSLGVFNLPIWKHHSISPSGILMADLGVGLLSPLILSPIGSQIACIMLGIDHHHVQITYEAFQNEPALPLSNPFNHTNDLPDATELKWLAEFCTREVPTRCILLTHASRTFTNHSQMLGDSKWIRSICTSPMGHCIIVQFFDLRDSIDFLIRILSQSQPIKPIFVCETSFTLLRRLGWNFIDLSQHCQRLSDLVSLENQACLRITLDFDPILSHDDIFQAIDNLKTLVSGFGRILGFSDPWIDVKIGTRVRFFMEYYDPHATQLAYERLGIITFPDGYSVKVNFCVLCHHERQAMFFQKRNDPSPISSRKSSPSEKGARHRHTNSTISSNGFSVISEDPVDLCHPEDDPKGNEVDLDRIRKSLDRRTTCMIKNIPNKYTQQMLIDFLDETHRGRYDFIYLRMDFKNKCNVGYAFINFLNPQDILGFASRMLGKRWPRFNSEKICALAYARIQGKSALMDKFRNSRVMQEPPSYRPRVFNCTIR